MWIIEHKHKYSSVGSRWDKMGAEFEIEKDANDVVNRLRKEYPKSIFRVVPKKGHKKNPPRNLPVDEVAAKELYLYISNDGDLYRQQGQPIIANLVQKIDRGVYDRAKAVKLYMYLVENGAKKYTKEFAGTGDKWNDIFNKPTRELVAKNFVASFEEEYKLGNFEGMHKKKYAGKAGVLSNPSGPVYTLEGEQKIYAMDTATRDRHKRYLEKKGYQITRTFKRGNVYVIGYRKAKGNPAKCSNANIYDLMKKAGVKIESHESDMYVPVNETTTAILKCYPYKSNVKSFVSQIDGKRWYDIPFGYKPFWDKKLKKNPMSKGGITWKSFTATYQEDGSKHKWYFGRDSKHGWLLKDPNGYVRVLEKTWIDSVPRINMILDNHGMKANIS